jgi:hypothetical protein
LEFDYYSADANRKIRSFAIASGAAAILAIAFNCYQVFQTLNFYANLDLPTPIVLFIRPLAVVAAMIMCATHAFAFYGKKKSPLWGISAAILAGFYIFLCVMQVFGTYMYSTMGIVHMLRYNVAVSVVSFVLGVVFAILALKYLVQKVKINIKALPIIALAVLVASGITTPFLLEGFVYDGIGLYMASIPLGSLFIVPFMLFALFCPPEWHQH